MSISNRVRAYLDAPLGNLYRMEVWADRSLASTAGFVFNAGTHKDALRLKYSEYAELAKPIVAEFGVLRAA